jgi:copper transport protein
VLVIVVTGLVQSWRQVGSIDALTSTPYGHLLIIKVVAVAVLVVLGGMSRRFLQDRLVATPVGERRLVSAGPGAAVADPGAASVQRLRLSIAAEVAVAVVIVAVTSLLVNAQPAASAVAKPFSTELRAGKLLIDVVVDPAKVGPAQVHVYTLSAQGAVQEVPELKATLRQPSRDIGPITVPLTRAGPGHFVAPRVELPLSGTWQLDVVVRLTEIDEVQTSTTFTVR